MPLMTTRQPEQAASLGMCLQIIPHEGLSNG